MNLTPWRNKSRSSAPLAQRPSGASGSLTRSRMEDLFERFWQDPWGTSLDALLPQAGVMPQLELTETDDHVRVRAELPGVRAEDVNIEVTGNLLRISGEKSQEREETQGDCRFCERQFGSFSRTVTLPMPVDAEKVDAACKDGVLTITLPKNPDHKPRRIKVSGE